MRSLLVIISMMAVFSSCSTKQHHNNPHPFNPREYQIGAYLWQQTSGEYRALTYQAYNLARTLIERDLQNKHNKKRAVIFDIDETILDNSFGGAREIQMREPWNENQFANWVKLKQAVAIPGALDFIKFLEQNRVEVFYVSNRTVPMLEDTIANLTAQGFPVKRENVLLKADKSTKEPRRQEIAKKHEIVLLVGDNLTDFHQAFDDKKAAERNAVTDAMKAEFGTRFIVLPNPLYGDWERALPWDKSRIELLRPNP